MKKLLFGALAMLLLGAVHETRADSNILQEQKSLLAELNSGTNKFNELVATREGFAKRFDVLKDAQGMVTKQVGKYKADKTALDTEAAGHASTVAAHNAACGGASPDAGHVSACNAEAARLNGVTAQIKQRYGALEANRKLLKEAIETQTTETEKVVADDNAALEQQRTIIDRQAVIANRLKAIQSSVDHCQAAIAADDAHPNCDIRICHYKEDMQAACAAMFDGNRP